jgi:hypothetical protein
MCGALDASDRFKMAVHYILKNDEIRGGIWDCHPFRMPFGKKNTGQTAEPVLPPSAVLPDVSLVANYLQKLKILSSFTRIGHTTTMGHFSGDFGGW